MIMPDRNGAVSGTNYRYGFQAQECDQEMSNSASHYAFEYRIHDARIGRFLSIDPLAAKYSYNSPYAFSENRVIDMIELEGLEISYTKTPGNNGYTVIGITIDVEVINSTNDLSKSEIKKYAKQIKIETEKKYSNIDRNDKIIYRTKVNLKFSKEIDPVNGYSSSNSTFKLDLRGKVGGGRAPIGQTQRNTIVVYTKQWNSEKFNRYIYESENKSLNEIGLTGAHEFGHSMGLLHGWDEYKEKVAELRPWYPFPIDTNVENIMRYGSQTEGANTDQFKAIIATIDKDTKKDNKIKDIMYSVAGSASSEIKK